MSKDDGDGKPASTWRSLIGGDWDRVGIKWQDFVKMICVTDAATCCLNFLFLLKDYDEIIHIYLKLSEGFGL